MVPEEERSADLLDVALRDEIELVSDLVVAASTSARHFTPSEVDELLGIRVEGLDARRAVADPTPAAAPTATLPEPDAAIPEL